MAEIKIYGDIVPFKWYNDGSEIDLKDVSDMLSALSIKEGEELIVNIHTFGGCTTTAFGIFNMLLRFKKDNNIKLTTRVDGWCASSGVIVLLAGDRRIGNKFAEPFVHNAWMWVMIADKNEAQKVYEELTKTDNQIATLYEDRTSISKDKALQLMNVDTFLTPEECMNYGFYTELENVYAAENTLIFNSLRQRRQNNSNNNSEMSGKSNDQKPEKKTLIQELKNLVNVFTGGAKNKIVFTAENKELDFYELAEDATPVVGDKALFDGKPAGESNDGEYVLATGETYKFTGEELTEIIPADEEGDTTDLETENAELKKENERLIAENAELTSSNKALNSKVKTANEIINKFNALDLSDDEDEDENDEDENDDFAFSGGVSSRQSKPIDRKNSKEKVKTSDLFSGIK